MFQNTLRIFGLFSCLFVLAEEHLSKNATFDEAAPFFVQLPDGRYVPFLEKSPEKPVVVLDPLANSGVIVPPDKKSFFERVKKFFITPVDCTIPFLGNIKERYYRWEYLVIRAAQEFYDDCFSGSLFTSKEQTVLLAKAYFFNFIGRWMTPSGPFDAVISHALQAAVLGIVACYNLSDRGGLCVGYGLYSLYTMATKEVDLKWYLAAFLYHVGLRPEVNNYIKTGTYREMILLGLCAPGMVRYLI